MKRAIIGGLTAALLAGGFALSAGGPAAATVEDTPQTDGACYAQVVEYKYKRTVETETFKTQYEIDKYVRDRTRTEIPAVKGIWQNFSPNDQQGTFEGPPFWPTDARGTWQHKDPKDIPGGHQGPDGVYQKGQGNGSWFYRQAGSEGGYTEWTAWSAPYRWEPIGSHLAWVDVVPAPNWKAHGEQTDTYQRQWSEYPTGNEKQVSTGTESSVEKTGWVTEAPEGEGWVQFKERTVQGERIPCPVEKLRLTFIQECGTFTAPDGPWVAPENVQWRLRNGNDSPTKFVLRQAGGGVIDEGMLPVGDSFVETPFGKRTLILETYNYFDQKTAQDTKAGGDTFLTTDDDEQKCLPPTPEDEVSEGEWVGEPECGEWTYDVTRTVTTISYTWNGSKFVAGEPDETVERDEWQVEVFEPCPPTPPTPTPTPPTPTPPTDQVGSQSPPATPLPATPQAAAPQAAAPQAAAPTTGAPAATLPATGLDSTGITALLALLVTSLGGAALVIARRGGVTS